jgi:RecJ-like exonuclease
MDVRFSVKIVKSLDKEFISSLPSDKILFFVDLASGSLNYIQEAGLSDVFIIDHHEVIQTIPSGVEIINPELSTKQKISASGLVYLFVKELNSLNKDSAKLAILGMIGDTLEKDLDKLNHGILEDADVVKKRGLLIYPSTRPINRALEYSSNPYIPGVTGDSCGVIELLRDSGLSPINGKYKSLIELNNDEMERLVTSVTLRCQTENEESIVGDIYLIKLFNRLEDARELSAKINACSRLGDSYSALLFCLEILL